jgi:hypothetical protein
MRVQLAQQARELLGQSDLVLITERGRSWGWTAVSWLAHILTEGDHRKVSVEAYITGMPHTLSHLTTQVITPFASS